MQELVSIIIPAYNAERWLSETIRSALNQTWPHKEIIIVDDGSTDNTLTTAKQFESKIVKVVGQENAGASAARNKGLSLAQGGYVQWLDADDLLAPDKIMTQLKHADRGNESRTLFTSSFGTFFFCYQRAKFMPTSLWRDLSPIDWLVNKFNETVWMNPAVWLVSRKLTEEAGPWNERLIRDNDGEYVCRVVAKSQEVKFVGEGISYYRVGNFRSLSTSTSDKSCESLLLSLDLCIQCLLTLENTTRTRNACVNLLQAWMPFLYPEKEECVRRLRSLAAPLGAHLTDPRSTWKYYGIQKLFGWKVAKKVMTECRAAKWNCVRGFDKLLFQISNRSDLLGRLRGLIGPLEANGDSL